MKYTQICVLAAVAAASASAQQAPSPPPQQQWPRKIIAGGLPSVSPDDKYIAFSATRDTLKPPQIFIIQPDGTGERQLTTDGGGGFPLWAPNSAAVVFEGRGGMSMISLDGGQTRTMTTPAGGRGFMPSPDGSRLVYSSGRPPTIPLIVSRTDGSSPKEITTLPGLHFNAMWSPDGKQIAYARMDSTRDMQLWIVNADGSEPRQVTHFTGNDGRPQWPSWSPDGKSIAVQSGNEGSSHIWIVEVASGKATKLAAHSAKYLDETPSFFHDGKRIAFQSDRTGTMHIWVMNVDGTGARQITK